MFCAGEALVGLTPITLFLVLGYQSYQNAKASNSTYLTVGYTYRHLGKVIISFVLLVLALGKLYFLKHSSN